MKAQVFLNKGFFNPKINRPTWAIQIQRGKHRYTHLPTIGTSNLKARVNWLNEQAKDYDVSNRDIWALTDCTCKACSGIKLKYHKAEHNKDAGYGPEECPRCAGKGYMTVSDEARWESWQQHKLCEELGLDAPDQSNKRRPTAYQLKKAKIEKLKAKMNAEAANKKIAKETLTQIRYEFEPPTDYRSVTSGW